MGACIFTTTATGDTAQAAFANAVNDAAWEHGHGGYTGTIAEKQSFVTIPDTMERVRSRVEKADLGEGRKYMPDALDRARDSNDPQKQAWAIARALLEIGDDRIDNKWGPAGCILIKPKTWLFFGWASE